MATTDKSFAGLLIEHRARSLERSFRAFAEAAWPVLEPATPFVAGRHIDIVSEYLEAVTAGQIRRLIINMPPRMMKSTLTTILFPCWSWAGDGATSRWMCTSYAASLSVKHSIDRRTLLTSDWYQRLWPKVQLASDQNEKSQFASTNRGLMLALSIGGGTTGKGGDFLLIDDPHSVEQALSDAERASGVRYIRQTLMTRLDDPRTGKIVLIMQRLHELDATGELLRDGGWAHLCLPAIAEQRQVISLPSGRVIVREEGDLLEPQRLSLQTLDGLKKSMGSFAFAGQMQQQPAPAEGGLFKRSWWQRYTVAPPSLNPIVQSWDCTFKDGPSADYVVGQIWGFDGQLAYLLDQMRARMSYTATKQAMREMYIRWPKTSAVLVEDKANGSAIIDELKREISGLIAVEPEGGKFARAWACTAQVEAGQVYLPETAWAEDFLLECSMFPNAAHDDMVDSMTQVLNWRRMHSFGIYSALLGDWIFNLADMGPGFGNCGSYQSRYISVSHNTSGVSCFLEILDDGKCFWICREYFNDNSSTTSMPKTEAALADDLAMFESGTHPLTQEKVLRSNRDAIVIISESATNLRSELWARDIYFQNANEDLGAVQMVASVMQRKMLRVSAAAVNTIQQHMRFAYDQQKAKRGDAVPQSVNAETCEAVRFYVKHNAWRLYE